MMAINNVISALGKISPSTQSSTRSAIGYSFPSNTNRPRLCTCACKSIQTLDRLSLVRHTDPLVICNRPRLCAWKNKKRRKLLVSSLILNFAVPLDSALIGVSASTMRKNTPFFYSQCPYNGLIYRI